MANENGKVSVDRDFARFGSKSYAINKINSVEVRERKPHGEVAAVGWGLLTLILVLMVVASLPVVDGGTVTCLLFAGLFGWLAYLAHERSKIVEYQLFLMTSSSEAQAIVSQDEVFISSLRNRIEAAMTGQVLA